MNNPQRRPPALIMYHLLSPYGIYLLLYLLLWGCSTTPAQDMASDSERIQSTDTSITQPFSPLPENIPDKQESRPGPKSQSKSLKFQEQDQGTCLLLIPAPQAVQIQAEYEHPHLKLDFSSGITKPDLPKIPQSCPVQGIEFSPVDSAKIQGLQLELKKRIQFLLSRSDPEQIRLSLIPRHEQETAQKTAKGQDGQSKSPEPSLELQDLDFSLDQEKQLRISLQASGPIEYQPLPQKDQEVRILLPQLNIPQNLDKFYNLDKFQAAAESLWLKETDAGSELRINLKDRVPFNVDRQGNQLLITFQEVISPKQVKEPQQASVQGPEEAQARSQSTGLTPEQLPAAEAKTKLQEAGLDSPRISPGLQDDYQGKPISIDLQDAEVEHVLRLIAEVGNFNLILDEEVQGRISLKLSKVPWDQALDLVLMQKDLAKVHKDNIMRITTAEQLEKEQQRIIQARKSALEAQQSQQEIAPLQTEYIQINYAKAAQLEPQVSNFLSDRGKVSVDSRTNQLIVSDTTSKLEQIQGVIQKLDRPERQVLIEARLVYATDTFQRDLGLRWGWAYSATAREGDLNYGVQPESDGYMVNLPNIRQETFGLGAFVEKISGQDMFALDARLSLGEAEGLAQTISSPRVVTLTNQKALIEQGTRIQVNRLDEAGNTITEYVEATLKLEVTPQITPDNKIVLDLNIEDDTPAPGESDDIETKSTQTKLMVDNGQTIVLGGVQQIMDEAVRSRVPGLANLPLLGYLFKSRQQEQRKNELLIFIQPRILETR